MKTITPGQFEEISIWALEAFERADNECQYRKEHKQVQGNMLAIKTLAANILKSLGVDLPGPVTPPWRKVVSHHRFGVQGFVKNTLECGHETKVFSGDATSNALNAKKHRCQLCVSNVT